MDTQCSNTLTGTHTHTHRWPDAVSGELHNTLILRPLMALINHMILNHFRGTWEGVVREKEIKCEI